nr:MAG TPA: hypothetical protein [Caudoviricetes sp.]
MLNIFLVFYIILLAKLAIISQKIRIFASKIE